MAGNGLRFLPELEQHHSTFFDEDVANAVFGVYRRQSR